MDDGDHVREGQPLFVIDDRAAMLVQRKADLALELISGRAEEGSPVLREHELAALAAIRAENEAEITYNGAGLTDAPIMAIFTDAAGLAFQGPGATVRQTNFEIAQAALPQRPRKGNTILQGDGGRNWKVIDITKRDDVSAWVLIVEEAQS